jgi:hypothetical protein
LFLRNAHFSSKKKNVVGDLSKSSQNELAWRT